MTETFLVLLAGGVMLAAFISDPREVTVNWLRLAGIISLAVMTVLRAICAIGIAMVMLQRRPIELFWDRFGLFVITRWAVGLLIPALFIYMAYDCIKRRATQSATGILYVAGILIFIGEIISL